MIGRTLTRSGSNACGSDGIASRLIKLVLPYILSSLEHIFNFSLTHGVFPCLWKSAVVCLIPKTGNPTSAEHYRLISILPALAKSLERIVSEQIRDYLERAELFDPFQSAYRKGHSTQICVICMLDDIRLAADRRLVIISVFLDFSKAFDRV